MGMHSNSGIKVPNNHNNNKKGLYNTYKTIGNRRYASKWVLVAGIIGPIDS